MTTPTHVTPVEGVVPPMTRERWRAVDAILQAALACDPLRREAVVAAACGDDATLRAEVESLLAAHSEADAFLEQPAAASFGARDDARVRERLAKALDGRYSIAQEIARGGMATVYRAHDVRHGRRVAIKVLREELAAAVGAERFLSEIRVTALLQHPHILPLFDSGSADGLLWYAMPFIEGETLRGRLARGGPLPVVDAVRIAREVADALDHAHVHGIVHRDVKPENILLQDGHALVADFGIALALEQAGGDRITRTGLALGTPQYMAPEQAAGERALDARVDVYSLGALLHEMLAGAPPFAATTRQEVVRRMMHDQPPGLATRRPDVPPFVDAAVRRALAKHAHDRFPSAAAFAAVLATPLNGNPRATVTTDVPPAASRGRTVSARGALYAALAMLAMGIAGGALLDPSSLLRRLTDGAPAQVSPPPIVHVAPGAPPGGTSLVLLDRSGSAVSEFGADRPWTPRFSPDGKFIAYGAFGSGRETSDLWVTQLANNVTVRLTDDDGDANDPQWSADGKFIAYSAGERGSKDVFVRSSAGGGERMIAARDGMQYPSDWLRDGSALLVTEEAGENGRDILVQPADGSAARHYAATSANETAARVSPDGRWVAYTSDESGRADVYLDSFTRPGRARTTISLGGGAHPVWRADGRELYYWRDGALIAVRMAASVDGAAPVSGAQTVLFRANYDVGVNTMYDVSPDGQRFVIVRQR